MPRLPVSMLMSAVALPLAAVAFAYFLGSSVPEYHAAWQHRDGELLALRLIGQLSSAMTQTPASFEQRHHLLTVISVRPCRHMLIYFTLRVRSQAE